MFQEQKTSDDVDNEEAKQNELEKGKKEHESGATDKMEEEEVVEDAPVSDSFTN